MDTNWNKFQMTSETGLLVKSVWNSLIAAIRRNVIVNGANYKVSRTSEGTALEIDVRAVGEATYFPFSLYDASTTEDEVTTYLLGVRNGTITTAGILTNGSGSELPTGMTAGGDPAFTVEISNQTTAWIELTIDDEGEEPEITDIDINIGLPAAIPTNTSTVFAIVLGEFAKDEPAKGIAIGSGRTGIGAQFVEGWRNWFAYPKTFSYANSAVIDYE